MVVPPHRVGRTACCHSLDNSSIAFNVFRVMAVTNTQDKSKLLACASTMTTTEKTNIVLTSDAALAKLVMIMEHTKPYAQGYMKA
jgi:hypothetical protein